MTVPLPGAILAGKYALHRRLGAGGYGSVYEGENIDLGKRVAIKLIAHRHAQSQEAVARFRREARASAKIESSNIVQVFDVGNDPEAGLYMVMELLRGEDLRRKLDRAGKLDVVFAVDIAHQIACGLAKAHAAGVVHRDLKPANIFLHQPTAEADELDDTRVLAKIVDFGVAKLLDDAVLGEAPQNPLTVAGKTVGTPQYMSPEQVQGQPCDHRGDLWALGALLHEMVTGQPAFALHDTFQQTALAIVHSEPPSLASVARHVPPELVAVIERALQKSPDARYPDATSFAEALMHAVPEALEDERAAARAAEIMSVHPRRAARSVRPAPPTYTDLDLPIDRRRTGVIVAISVLAAAAMILVLAAANRHPETKPAAAGPSILAVPSTPADRALPPVPSPVPSVELPLPEPPAPAEAPSVIATASTTAIATVSEAPPAAPVASTSVKPTYKAPEQFGGTGVTSKF